MFWQSDFFLFTFEETSLSQSGTFMLSCSYLWRIAITWKTHKQNESSRGYIQMSHIKSFSILPSYLLLLKHCFLKNLLFEKKTWDCACFGIFFFFMTYLISSSFPMESHFTTSQRSFLFLFYWLLFSWCFRSTFHHQFNFKKKHTLHMKVLILHTIG